MRVEPESPSCGNRMKMVQVRVRNAQKAWWELEDSGKKLWNGVSQGAMSKDFLSRGPQRIKFSLPSVSTTTTTAASESMNAAGARAGEGM